MSSTNVVFATEADIPRCIRFLADAIARERQFGRGGEEHRGYPQRSIDVRERISCAIADEASCVIVAEGVNEVGEGAIEAVALVRCVKRMAEGSTVACIEELHNASKHGDHRMALIDHAANWAREMGCVRVDYSVVPGDREGKSLGETMGFTARLLVMSRPLRP